MPAHLRNHDADLEAPDAGGPSWWSSLGHRRLAVGLASTLLALPLVVLDNLPNGPRAAQAVEVVGEPGTTSAPSTAPTTVPTTGTTPTIAGPASRQAAPTTAPATTATTAAPTTATTAAPATTAPPPPPTSPPTTAAPPPPSPPEPPTTTAPPPPPPPAGNTQSGQATWFHAHNPGECAHRTLPFGTIVTITNLATGASTTCPVRDRGPFGAGRIIDLDDEVFARIAPLSQGVIQVTITW